MEYITSDCSFAGRWKWKILANIYLLNIWRFIYIRFATELVRDGVKLLHWLTFIFIVTFSTNLSLIWQVKYNLIDGSKYRDTLKGKFCMKTNITFSNSSQNIYEEVDDVELSIKPKLVIFSIATLFCGLSYSLNFSVKKWRYPSIFKSFFLGAWLRSILLFMNYKINFTFPNILLL